MRRVGPAFLLALGACATAGDAFVSPPPASFREVRSLVLVRLADARAGRQKDPLDGLQETLRARGYVTRVIELDGGKSGEHAALDRLFVDLEGRAGAAPGERFGTRPYANLGRSAADTVGALGVDAVATYHRLDGRRPLGADAPLLPGTVAPGPPVSPARGPMGAIAIVDRTGQVATFAWGATSAIEDPEVPVNAAEAIDLVVRALSGELADE